MSLTQYETAALGELRRNYESSRSIDADGTQWGSVYLDNLNWPQGRKHLSGVLGSLAVKGLYREMGVAFGEVRLPSNEPPAGTYAATARVMADSFPDFDWDAWKEEMKDAEILGSQS